jgi:hypothetical protein
MGMTPEQKARVSIDGRLVEAGWCVRCLASADIHLATCLIEIAVNLRLRFAQPLQQAAVARAFSA